MTDKRRQILAEIQKDAEYDARKWEGEPLTGQTVATMLGETLAMISALARIVDTILEEEGDG